MLQANPSNTRIHRLSRKSTRKIWRVSRQCEIAEARHHGMEEILQLMVIANRVARRIHYTAPKSKWHKLISSEIYDRIEMVTTEGVLHRGSTKFVEGEASANCSKDGPLLLWTATHWLLCFTIWLGHKTCWCGIVNLMLYIVVVYYILVWSKLSHQYIFWKSRGRGCGGASTWSIG